MKNVKDLASYCSFNVVCDADSGNREINDKIYCCDLLSIVMGRAPTDGVWVTVMANINTIAVAVLCDVGCVIIAEGMNIDETTIERAKMQGINLLATDLPVYQAARLVEDFNQCQS